MATKGMAHLHFQTFNTKRSRKKWIYRMLWHMEHSFPDEKFYEPAYRVLTKEL